MVKYELIIFFFVFRYVVLYVLATIWNSDIMTSPGKDVTVRRTVSRWSAVWVTHNNASIHTYRNVIVFYSNFLKILPRETLRDDTAPASIDVCVRSLNLLLETTRFTVRLRFSFLLSRVSFIFSVVCVVFTHTHTSAASDYDEKHWKHDFQLKVRVTQPA